MLRYARPRKGDEDGMDMRRGRLWLGSSLMLALVAAPATAQFSDSYKFLKAVRDRDGEKVTEVLGRPGSTSIDARGDDGDAALHIVVKRRDTTWLAFLLAKGAKPDLRNGQGDTPLGLAAQIGFDEGVKSSRE